MSNTGFSVDYYRVGVTVPNQAEEPYTAECGDIIEALGMTFPEACAFKAIWRKAAARTLGKVKDGNTELYDAEKIVFYAGRILATMTATPVPLTPSSVAMNEARKGGQSDTGCPYLAFPNNRCNKCGREHDGLDFIRIE